MPELPEVEVMVAKVNAWASGFVVKSVAIHRQNGKYAPEGIAGAGIIAVFRRGKQMIFQCTGDKVLVAHNAMSGYWDASDDNWTFDYVEGKRRSTDKDIRVTIELDSGRRLRFHDSRLFGRMYTSTWSEVEKECGKLGPEAIRAPRMFPLSPVLNVLDMAVVCDSKKAIKEVLLDQTRIAGIGNIYAVESLWKASVHPGTPANELGTQELSALTDAIGGVLKGALDRNLDYDGLMIYRRKSCMKGHTVEKVEVAKRSTYFCPKCQGAR